jgi:hypothetical protein
VYAYDDDGKQLIAEYDVKPDGDQVALVLASSSGADPSGRQAARNPNYRAALLVLLQRLRCLDSVIDDAFVDSETTRRRGLSEDERRIIDPPVKLCEVADLDALRKELQERQRPVGRGPGGSSGNSTKRIWLRLTVPGFGPEDARQLADELARPIIRAAGYASADEISPDPGQTFAEGAVKQVTVNKYERDPRARSACLAEYGYKCVVCGMNFELTYGEIGKDFIHVHHLRELSALGKDYKVNPVTDLRPVCPNCHAMLHRKSPALMPEELKSLMPPKSGPYLPYQ